MFAYTNFNMDDLRKLAGLPEVKETEETPVDEGIKDKVGDTPHGIPGPSGGNDELLDEVDEDEDAETDDDELEEEVEEEVESGEEEIAEEIVGELNNGYKKHHVVDGDDYFPTGQDQSVSDEAGPASAKHGDNPMQKKIKVQVEEGKEIHRKMVYDYREFISEADNRMRELNDEHTRLIQNLLDAKARNDEQAIAVLRRKLADNENELERLNLGS